VAVHGGSGVSFGVIEQLRASRPDAKFLELVHRLDRETSGLLLLAKKRSALTPARADARRRHGQALPDLVAGDWKNARQHIKLPCINTTAEGERRVAVQADGLASHGVFTVAEISQLRLAGSGTEDRPHAPDPRAPVIVGFPIAGDDKYGDLPSTSRCRRTARAAPSSACSCMRTRSRSRIRKRARR
jgi:23S rRNA pseudouridine955/2504/2580 synthase